MTTQTKKKGIPGNRGAEHFGFTVPDIEEAVTWLKENKITVQGEPVKMSEGPNAGETWVYFLSPWGMQLELVSYEKGQAYEKSTGKRAFKPGK